MYAWIQMSDGVTQRPPPQRARGDPPHPDARPHAGAPPAVAASAVEFPGHTPAKKVGGKKCFPLQKGVPSGAPLTIVLHLANNTI